MNSEAALFIEISHSTLESVKADFERTNSMTVKSRLDFYKAHELPVKAIIVEKGGSLNQENKLTNLCKSIGLWPVIPPKLQSYLREIDSYGLDFSPPNGLIHKGDEWRDRLAVATRFVFFIENQILRNPTVLKGIGLS
jgi:hypothetical protein